jgi:hypothetical protein
MVRSVSDGFRIRCITKRTEEEMYAGSMKGNASNVFRMWCMVKEGVVTDTDGKQWKQVGALKKKGIATANVQLQGPRSVYRWDWSCGSDHGENCYWRYRGGSYRLRG